MVTPVLGYVTRVPLSQVSDKYNVQNIILFYSVTELLALCFFLAIQPMIIRTNNYIFFYRFVILC